MSTLRMPGVLRRRRQRRERRRLPRSAGSLRSRAKKNALFLTIGPPSTPPYWLRRSGGFWPSAGLKKVVAFSAVSRKNSQRVAVELVRAAAVGDVDRRAGGAPVLGALVVGDDAELADRVGRRLHHLVREALVAGAVGVVVDAVDQEVVERAAQAVDVERAFARRAVGALVQRRLADAGREQRQRRVLAAVQRQLAHLVAGDHLAALARVGLDERRRSR